MKKKGKKTGAFFSLVVIGIIIMFFLALLHIRIGMSDITYETVFKAIFQNDASKAHLIISSIRFPRVLLCLIIGASMAMAGMMIQQITNNPLASPQVLGVNAGASLAVVTMIMFFPSSSYFMRIIVAFIGAGVIGSLVQGIAYIKRLNILELSLLGLSVQMLLSAIIKAFMLLNESKTSDLLFWMSGSVQQAQMNHIRLLLPWFIIAFVLSMIIGRSLDTLKLGDQVATSLGTSVSLVKGIGIVSVILLAGSSVAIAGPVAFIGLIIPHLIYKFNLISFRSQFILCGIYGSNLLLLADIIAKLLKYPYESPVGIVTSFLGAAFYIALFNRQRKRGVAND